ncbi:DUF4261 domain-containing protein [Harryflintia acetispora]|uniref:DUF4261 domain-containing protein n=1 Tax=Harryflintia acetispora TaxID=1849041 RepID=UPI001899D9FC|nr:DUF4261 domain-containing protein [Harryflintia acetispora]
MGEQYQAALKAMSAWLADEHRLGAPPYKIECTGDFLLHGLRYYLFRYKKHFWGRWLLGVCGGYEGDSLEHCGHVLSDKRSYDPAKAREQATAMVERLRPHRMDQAQEKPEPAGPFLSFVLLEQDRWDPQKLRRDLAGWGIDCPQETQGGGQSLVWEVEGMLAVISLMPSPIPGGEAEENAHSNYMWPGAAEAAKAHLAHLDVAVISRGRPPEAAGALHVKLCAAALLQSGTLGLYTNGSVLQPEFYLEAAELLRKGELPILNLVFVGLYRSESGVGGYTCGLRQFGCHELEVLDSTADPDELRSFLYDVAGYVLREHVVLHGGETVGFSTGQKLALTLSPGVSVEGESLKVVF